MLRRAFFFAARRLAGDPRVQRKVAEVVQNDVMPRARGAARSVGSRLRAGRDELRDIADEVDPVREPGRFVARIKKRFLDPD